MNSPEQNQAIFSEAYAAVMADQRKRFEAVLALPAAKGREVLALRLGITSDMSLDAIAEVLATVPASGTTTPTIAERAAESPEAGRGNGPGGTEAGGGWGSVIAAANAEFAKLEGGPKH